MPARFFSPRRMVAPVLGALLALSLGCSKQGEGERCDQNNGDLDCETGLACVGETQISVQGRGFALCCPILTDPTVDACRANTGLTPEPDAGIQPPPAPPGTPDAGNTPPPAPDAGNVSTPPGDGGT